MDIGSRRFLAHHPDWVSRFETNAEPTCLDDSFLRFFGHKRHKQFSFIVRCPEYQHCTVFFKMYFKFWWIALGQSCNILESYRGKRFPENPNVLRVTYNLTEPIYFRNISTEQSFEIYSPATKLCYVHDLYDGQPMNPQEPLVLVDSLDCVSKAERLTFCFNYYGS